MGKIIGIDLGTTNSCVAVGLLVDLYKTYGDRKHRRRKNNAVSRSVYKDRRASRRRAGKTSGSYKRRQNNFFYQKRDGKRF